MKNANFAVKIFKFSIDYLVNYDMIIMYKYVWKYGLDILYKQISKIIKMYI